MNLSVIRNYRFWIAVVAAVLGVSLSQGIIVEGSTLYSVVGWVLTVIGTGFGGAQLAGPKAVEEPQQ